MTHALSRLTSGLAILILAGCTNGAWTGDKTYIPPETDNIAFVGFNVDSDVALLLNGILPIVFSRDVFNSGQGTFSGYTVREEIILTIFAVQGGAAAFEVSDVDQQTVFRCEQPGPTVPPGGTATVSFTVPSANCQQLNPASPPAAILPALPCGLYREVLTIDPDNAVTETSEADNVAVHYFQVPSMVQALNINTVRNPNNNPLVTLGPGPDEVTVRFDAGPVVTHRHTINALPAGSTFIARAPTPVVSTTAADVLTVAPMPLGTLPNGVTGPRAVNVTMTPNATFVGPLTDILLDAFIDKVGSSLTAFTTDGCLSRQASHPVRVIHPAQ